MENLTHMQVKERFPTAWAAVPDIFKNDMSISFHKDTSNNLYVNVHGVEKYWFSIIKIWR